MMEMTAAGAVPRWLERHIPRRSWLITGAPAALSEAAAGHPGAAVWQHRLQRRPWQQPQARLPLQYRLSKWRTSAAMRLHQRIDGK